MHVQARAVRIAAFQLFTLLLLVSGCARRAPEPGLEAKAPSPGEACRTLGVRFEQTGGACVPYPNTKLAFELLGQRCDEETLASGLRRLRQESGPERVEAVLKGERVPGSDRHRVVVRYASATPGSCPLNPRAGAASCEDCQVGKVLVALMPSDCQSKELHDSILQVVKEDAPTCKAEALDAARARVGGLATFHRVEVLCTSETDDGLRRVLVLAERNCGQAAGWGDTLEPGDAPPRQLTCTSGVVCSPMPGGGTECDCR